MIDYEKMAQSHDLTLPDWGPYAHDVQALSHIADVKRGLMMDFFMVAGIPGKKLFPPDPLHHCGCFPMDADPEFHFFRIHQDMDGIDRLFAETSYSYISENFRLGRMEIVNRTDRARLVSCSCFARFPHREQCEPVLPPGSIWVHALDYKMIHYAGKRMDTHLVYDGGRRGEEHDVPCAVGGRCVGWPPYCHRPPCFGENAGDSLVFDLTDAPASGRICLRIMAEKGHAAKIELVTPSGQRCFREIQGTGNFEAEEFFRGKAGCGIYTVKSLGCAGGFRMDGLFILPDAAVPDVKSMFPPITAAVRPRAESQNSSDSVLIRAHGMNRNYLCRWSAVNAVRREYCVNDLISLLAESPSGEVQPEKLSSGLPQIGLDYCCQISEKPILLKPGKRVIRYFLCGGNQDMEALQCEFSTIDWTRKALENCYLRAETSRFVPKCTKAGRKYLLSQRLMGAVLMTDVGFPILCRGKNLRCHVPNKYYYSLYTWDSGFEGLGLLELDRTRAIENCNAYVTPPSDADCAFILHGTPLPVQIFLFAEIYNREPDRKLLEYFYPRLKHFYDFLTGRIEDSTFLRPCGMIAGWDYFYNSGGWDDYPPQAAIRHEKRNDIVPVVLTAHVIRCACILENFAAELGLENDILEFRRDAAKFAETLQKISWDAEENIFSYVVCNADGSPREFFRDPVSGRNFNLGLDGASPLISGNACTPEQKEKLIAFLEAPYKCWTDYGITTISMDAPYFKKSGGYWNGSVWMPHQWFFWKALLDCGRMNFARKIAMTALNIWEKEARRSRICREYISLEHGKPWGHEHFAALSSPVLSWFGAYFSPERLTGGYNLFVREKRETHSSTVFCCRIGGNRGESSSLLFVAGNTPRTILWNGAERTAREAIPGCLEFKLPCGENGILEIRTKRAKA